MERLRHREQQEYRPARRVPQPAVKREHELNPVADAEPVHHARAPAHTAEEPPPPPPPPHPAVKREHELNPVADAEPVHHARAPAQQEAAPPARFARHRYRSEEHTSELQSLRHLV